MQRMLNIIHENVFFIKLGTTAFIILTEPSFYEWYLNYIILQ